MGKYVGLPALPPDFVRDHAPLAIVVEESCIGCERCPDICFFDAITMKNEVAIINLDNCTGCGLCFEACPVDCIEWVPDEQVTGRPIPKDGVPGIDLGD